MQTDLFLPVLNAPLPVAAPGPAAAAALLTHGAKRWLPKRVLFTPDALQEDHGQQILARATALGLDIELLKSNRLTGLRGEDERATYRTAKTTLAVVNAPAGALRLQPTPPSADFQLNLAEGCPAHCQYCYLAGSLSGPPVVRAFANLPKLLANTQAYERAARPVSFEASCYTDVLGIEHLTGALAETVRYFAGREGARLRFVSKYDHIDGLLGLPHRGHTRARASLNAEPLARQLEGGTASIEARIRALRRLALPVAQGGGGYPVGVLLAAALRLAARPPASGLRFRLRPHGRVRHPPLHARLETGAAQLVPQHQPRPERGNPRREAQQVRGPQVRVPAAHHAGAEDVVLPRVAAAVSARAGAVLDVAYRRQLHGWPRFMVRAGRTLAQ